MGMSMTKYLKPIKSAFFRGKIRRLAFHKGFEMGKIGTENKAVLTQAIFEVENEREHSHGLHDPGVLSMRQVRNHLYDDLGWNERHPKEHEINPLSGD